MMLWTLLKVVLFPSGPLVVVSVTSLGKSAASKEEHEHTSHYQHGAGIAALEGKRVVSQLNRLQCGQVYSVNACEKEPLSNTAQDESRNAPRPSTTDLSEGMSSPSLTVNENTLQLQQRV